MRGDTAQLSFDYERRKDGIKWDKIVCQFQKALCFECGEEFSSEATARVHQTIHEGVFSFWDHWVN